MLHVPSIMCSLTGNCTSSCRDPGKMLRECKEALSLDLFTQAKRVLHYHKPTKFTGHITAEQRRQDRACGNHALVVNKIPKVESTLNKEERNKNVAVFPCWLEQLFPDLWLGAQGLIWKEGKNDRLVFDGSFLETLFSTRINQIVSTTDEIELHYGTAMARSLVKMHNLRTSYPTKEILLFDEETLGVFRHVKLTHR